MKRDNSQTTLLTTLPVWMKAGLNLMAGDRGISSSGFVRMLISEEINACNENGNKDIADLDLCIEGLNISRIEGSNCFNVAVYNEHENVTTNIKMSLGELVHQRKLRSRIADATKIIIPIVKPARWNAALSSIAAAYKDKKEKYTEEEEEGMDSIKRAIFETYTNGSFHSGIKKLNDFSSVKDLKVWAVDSFIATQTNIYFKISALLYRAALYTNKTKRLPGKGEAYKLLRKIGIKSSIVKFKGESVRVYSVPITLVKNTYSFPIISIQKNIA